MPRLVVTRRAERDLAALPDAVRDEVDATILLVGANPREEGHHLKGTFHCRWAAYAAQNRRVLYRIDGTEPRERVVVLAVSHRSVAYPRSRR